MIEEQVNPTTTTAEIMKFIPNTKNIVRVLAHNSHYNGPPSQEVSFDTPEGGKYQIT